jgi:tetratricopeptide (TPR) repeat protein
MRFGSRAEKTIWIAAGLFALTLCTGLAQKRPPAPANGAAATRSVLIEKAHGLDSRGRPDMAIQLWQQILLSEPNNAEALAGLARDLKLTGANDKASDALDKLRHVNPNDPNISKIQALTSTRAESDQLRRAGELARQGKVDEAVGIYRTLYGDNPPDGDIALAYYQTLYGTATGKNQAIAGMRALAVRNPGDSRYAIQLGTMLSYDQKTRGEGIRILEGHSKDDTALAALRQALIWDSANPASAGELRTFLKEHPQDSEVAGRLKEDEGKLAQMNSGIARNPAERAAFAALNAKRLDEAQQRFLALLDEDAHNGHAAAGMGFLRMQQKNFAGAISFLTQAEENGFKDPSVTRALATSRFWYTMTEAAQAVDEARYDVAQTRYKQALELNPHSPEALNGLAGLQIKLQQYQAAAEIYEQLVRVQPGNADGWRGLFLAYARLNEDEKALASLNRTPAGARATLNRDPEVLRSLASIYQAEHRTADAQRVLAEALALPFPEGGDKLKNDTKLQYAGILMEARHFDQAAELYAQVLQADPANQAAWMGIVSAHHELGQDTLAISDVKKMPPAAYEAALSDPGFLSMLAAIYQQANQFEVAQGLLERSVKLQESLGGHASVQLETQLAAIYLLRNYTQEAYAIYHRVLTTDPNRADAWKGLITALQVTNRNTEALQEIAQIPAQPRKELEGDIDFVQLEASLYAATGDTKHAMEFMARVEQHYAKLKQPAPGALEVQNAWLLYNTGNDRSLYPSLMKLGGRKDLTDTQRRTVQEIWAAWSVRRATAAMENGNYRRAVDILDAAFQAFPDNVAVRKAVAGGYARVGRAKEALAIFKTVPLQDASSGDFQGAVGAALSANDKTQAELWLRQALVRYPNDPAILAQAARYEQARGDNQRAAEYFRASLAAMPSASPVDRLAHTLAYPDTDDKARKAVTAADLQRLLDPANEPFQRTTKLPPLPAYGPDPYDGRAPIALPPAENTSPQRTNPASWQQNDQPASNPAVNQIPAGEQPTMREQKAVTLGDGQDQLQLRPAVNYSGGFAGLHPYQRRARRITLEPVDDSAGDFADDSAVEPASPRLPMRLRTVAFESGGEVTIQLNPPHSLASDAWKGLIFSLSAAGKNQDALAELAKVPADVRRQLESDIEFVQGVASIYVAVGDVPHAMSSLSRVEDFYLLRRALAPAGLEVQHAWLLFNLGNDLALYPVLSRIDTRTDLTPAQRQEIENLWATWAVRRANASMTAGNMLRGVQILQAASLDYPDNQIIRRAVAGAYARVGRTKDALELFKTIPMDDAIGGDYEGAISAALGAGDMAQAEAWLRLALARFPNDPLILEMAARFEQARGNGGRATDYWRAALAAMPPGSSLKPLDSYVQLPPGGYKPPAAGDTKRLLDPRLDPATQPPSLPAYPRNQNTPAGTPQSYQQQGIQPPAGNPVLSRAYQPDAGYAVPSPHARLPTVVQNGPVMIEQSSVQVASFRPAMRWMQVGVAATQLRTSSTQRFQGHMNLSADQQNVTNHEPGAPAPVQAQVQQGTPSIAPAPVWTPRLPALDAPPQAGLRITSQPMNPVAAQALAQFAEQTDSQLTQGSASTVTARAAVAQTRPTPSAQSALHRVQRGSYDAVQYTPSAQEATTGAYSAPRQDTGTPVAPPAPQLKPAPVQQTIDAPVPTSRKARRQARNQTLGTTTLDQHTPTPDMSQPLPSQQQTVPNADAQQTAAQTTTQTTGTGLTDEELQQRDLPPLRGPWVRVQRGTRPLTPREEAEHQLQAIESGYSSWMGGTGLLNYRSGTLGFDHLTALEAPFELSLAAGYHARLSIIAKPVFLDSGQADGNAQLTVLESTTSGTTMKPIPMPIGTLVATDSTPPAQQNAVGLGGEVQLAFPQLAISLGSTPYGFLVQTVTGRFYWKPGNGPLSINVTRDSVKDSQLSYGGLRDPAGNSLGTLGQIWGGVVANSGNLQFAKGNEQSGFYISAGGQYITGYEVPDNTRIDGSGGAYWRVYTDPEYGGLNLGVNFFAMRYDKNQDAFTHGMGGYFSPQGYFLANLPFAWNGHYETRWHYSVAGGLGVQAFQEDQTKLWPLVEDTAMETGQNNPLLPDKTSVGPNYDVHGQAAYQIGSHWFAGGYLAANNTRNYTSLSTGFFVRFLFREQPSTVAGPTGLFPSDGIRPFTVP